MPKVFRVLIIVCGLLALALIAGVIWLRSSIYAGISPAIDERLASLQLSGFNVRYDSIQVDWIKGVVRIDRLVLEKDPYDTTCLQPEFITADKVQAEGVGLVRLVLNKTLTLDRLTILNPHLHLRDGRIFADSARRKQKAFTIHVEELGVTGARYTQLDTMGCDVVRDVTTAMTATALLLEFAPDTPFSYQAEQLIFKEADIELPKAHYRIRVPSASWANREFAADSIKVIPLLDKLAFARAYGYEIDRFEATIPFFRVAGITMGDTDTTFVHATNVDVQFFLKVFRDKRLPFRPVEKPLPVALIRRLALPVRIDTLKVIRSYAEYEEWAATAPEAGKVYFDNLFATFHNIDNRATVGTTEFSARSNISGHGEVNVNVRLPLEAGKRAVVRGSIADFSLPEINPMLTPTTNILIESGKMEDLRFTFSFDQTSSAGEIQLNYRDLKVVSLKDGGNGTTGDSAKDNLKTFIMNMFVFRKHMDDNVPEEKRTGKIEYRRDATRSIFNYWVKSVVSGIKSAYNLTDKNITDKNEKAGKTPKEVRREERLARKEARKQRRAERKKSKG